MKLHKQEAHSKVAPVYQSMQKHLTKLQVLLHDIEMWESNDTDVLTTLAEQLYDSTSDINEKVGELYHWLHGVANTTPGLSRPMEYR